MSDHSIRMSPEEELQFFYGPDRWQARRNELIEMWGTRWPEHRNEPERRDLLMNAQQADQLGLREQVHEIGTDMFTLRVHEREWPTLHDRMRQFNMVAHPTDLRAGEDPHCHLHVVVSWNYCYLQVQKGAPHRRTGPDA